MKHYAAKGTLDILASNGPLPSGCTYVLIKADKRKKPIQPILDDGSFQGLFLRGEEGGIVRVYEKSCNGILSHVHINKSDVIIAIDGHEVHNLKECENALEQVCRDVIAIVTYNSLRKLKASFRVIYDSYEIGEEVSVRTIWLCLYHCSPLT